jgi:effector-binding domain-containing protein/uncharacterized protein YndB with AHSA1/START domain
MKFLKWFGIVIGIVITALLVIAAILPKTVEIKAETEINLSPEKLFHAVASYTDRELWDPWVSIDSTSKAEYVRTEAYLGSGYSWNGEKTGSGRMQIDTVDYGKYIGASIFFREGAEPSLVEWFFEPSDSGTMVTWQFSASGKYPIERLFINLMKSGLQKSLESGLANLKAHFEETGVSLSSYSDIEVVELDGVNAMVAGTSGTMDEITRKIESLFGEVTQVIDEQGLEVNGPPFAYYYNYNPNDETSSAYFGIPVTNAGKPNANVIFISLPSFKAVKLTHTGPWDEVGPAYDLLMNYIQENDLKATWEAFEYYRTDQMSTFPPFYKTDVYLTLK